MQSWDWTPLLAADNEPPEAVHRRWYAGGLVDGLPIVAPAPARVRRFYRAAGLDSVRQIAVVEPSQRPVSVYDVAVCAVAPDDVLIAVAGGIGVKSTYLPSWGGGTRTVTIPIDW